MTGMPKTEETAFTATEALELVSAYFDAEWPQTRLKDVKLGKVTGGFVNRLCALTRYNEVKREPKSILIRHFGLGKKTFYEEPLASSTTLSAAEQALIYHEMGRRGWGPKLYGVFPGGRLEEYLDAHPLTAAEAKEPTIRHDIAKSYARLHSLQLPFKKKKNSRLVLNEMQEASGSALNTLIQRLSGSRSGSKEATRFAAVLRSTDWSQEFTWVFGLFEKYDCKSTIAVGDANYLNVLVKDYRSDCAAVLIDYETCTYSYRGIDIGGHFNERMYCWSNPGTNMTGYPAPDAAEQRSFCRSYLEEMRELGEPITPMDTEHHLLIEATIGRMWQLLFSVGMGFGYEGLADERPALLEGLAHMLETYLQLKQDWLAGEH